MARCATLAACGRAAVGALSWVMWMGLQPVRAGPARSHRAPRSAAPVAVMESTGCRAARALRARQPHRASGGYRACLARRQPAAAICVAAATRSGRRHGILQSETRVSPAPARAAPLDAVGSRSRPRADGIAPSDGRGLTGRTLLGRTLRSAACKLMRACRSRCVRRF